MALHEALIFDAEKLPAALETREEAVLREFYELFQTQLLDLQEALAADGIEREAVRLLAHKFMSSSLAVGATRLGETLAALEERCLLSSSADIDVLVTQVESIARLTAEAVRARLQTSAT